MTTHWKPVTWQGETLVGFTKTVCCLGQVQDVNDALELVDLHACHVAHVAS